MQGGVGGGESPRMLALASWGTGTVSLLASAWVICCSDGAWNYSCTVRPKEEDLEHFKIACAMMIPVFLHEGAHAISASVSGVSLCGYSLCWVTLLQLFTKACCYAIMWTTGGGIAHPNLRSLDGRPVYTVRFIDWVVAVPALSASACFVFSSEKSPLHVERLAPMIFVSFSCVVASWVALVAPHATHGWTMMLLAGTGYFFSVSEQAVLVWERYASARHHRFKVSCWIMKEVAFCVYFSVLLASSTGLLSPASEQIFYTYGDVVMKTLQSSVLVVIRNWDELDRVESSLRVEVDQGKEDMSRFMETASVPIVCLSQEGVIQSWNQQISNVTLISNAVAEGKPFADFVAPQCREEFESSLLACKSKASTGAIELTLKMPNQPNDDHGATVTMNFIARLGSDPGNSGIIGVGHDITELVASKALQERHRQFMAIVSHELRSPLHGISGLSRVMADSTKDVVSKRQLNIIYGCSNRLTDLVCNISNQTYINNRDKHNSLEKRVPVNFLDIVDEVICMTCAAMDISGKSLLRHGVTLENVTALDKLPLVMGDPSRCTQLLYNLVSNACKFTNQGHVLVSASHVDSFIEVQVKDTGCGIASGALSTIFDMDKQEDTQVSLGGFQGIGLGLSVSSGIAKLHGGEIRVQSELGVGSTFTVRLPCEDEQAYRQFPKQASEDAVSQMDGSSECTTAVHKRLPARTIESLPTMSDLSGEWKKVLSLSCLPRPSESKPLLLSVCENTADQAIIDEALGTPYRVEAVKDGTEALDYLQSDQERPTFMLLVSDKLGESGFEVCWEIRSTLKLPHLALPVMVISSRAPLEHTALRAFEAGATDFLPKPFCARMLQKRMRVIQDMRMDYAILTQDLTQQLRDCRERERVTAEEDIRRMEEEVVTLKDAAQIEVSHLKLQLEAEASMRNAERVQVDELRLKSSALQTKDVASQVFLGQNDNDLSPDASHAPELVSWSGMARHPSGGLSSSGTPMSRQCTAVIRSDGVDEAEHMEPLGKNKQPAPASLCVEVATQTQAATHMQARRRRTAPAPACTEAGLGLARSLGREVRWLRRELELSGEALSQLSGSMSQRDAEARRQRCRADRATREAAFLKAELRRRMRRQQETPVLDWLAGA